MAIVHPLPVESKDTKAEDRACTAEILAASRMKTLINECSLGGRSQLTEARDRIDELMHALDARGELLSGAVTQYAGLVQQALEVKGIIINPIENLAGDVNAALPGVPGPALAQSLN
jgi:hypothetical protein